VAVPSAILATAWLLVILVLIITAPIFKAPVRGDTVRIFVTAISSLE